jgi:hypothetical protein
MAFSFLMMSFNTAFARAEIASSSAFSTLPASGGEWPYGVFS